MTATQLAKPPSIEGRSEYDGKLMTLEEFELLTSIKPSLEWVGGRAVQKPMVSNGHGRITLRSARRLDEHSDSAGGFAAIEVHTWFDVPADPRYLVPDAQYYAPGKARGGLWRRALPPTLVIEVRSPDSQTMEFLREKSRFMRVHGVDVCWLIDPRFRTVELFEDDADGVVWEGRWLTSPYLPGFALDIDELWALLDD